MDWSKAKTILIVAFLITNLLLAYISVSSTRYVETTTKDRFVEDVTDLLEKKNIFINTNISREIPSLNTLLVEYDEIEIHELNKNYFQSKGKINLKENNISEINYNDETITIENNKSIEYRNNKDDILYKSLNQQEAENLAWNFLKEKKYDVGDMDLYFIEEKENVYYLKFSKTYNERYLERAKTLIEIDHRGVRKLERTWLKVLEEGEKPIYISTAPKAISGLLKAEEVYGKTIIDVSLIYYFSPEDEDYQNIKKGTATPAWRVLFDDGYEIILDKY